MDSRDLVESENLESRFCGKSFLVLQKETFVLVANYL